MTKDAFLDDLLVPVHSDPHAFLNVCWGDAVSKIHHKLGKLLHIDDVPDHCLSFEKRTLLSYLGSSESALMILVHRAT